MMIRQQMWYTKPEIYSAMTDLFILYQIHLISSRQREIVCITQSPVDVHVICGTTVCIYCGTTLQIYIFDEDRECGLHLLRIYFTLVII